jgi:hypothetical protein
MFSNRLLCAPLLLRRRLLMAKPQLYSEQVVKLWELHVAEQLLLQSQDRGSGVTSGALSMSTPVGAEAGSRSYFGAEGSADVLNTSVTANTSFRLTVSGWLLLFLVC